MNFNNRLSKLLMFALLLTGLSISPALAATYTWLSQSTPSPDSAWSSITYGNNLFVAVATNGDVMTSPTGTAWTRQAAPIAGSWNAITYGNGVYVAVGSSGSAMMSPDGYSWTSESTSVSAYLKAVTFGNGLFVAVGSSTIITSPDGVTWTSRTSPASSPATGQANWSSITYGTVSGSGMFVAVTGNATATFGTPIMKSTDGISWSTAPAVSSPYPNNATYSGLAYGNGTFVVVSSAATHGAFGFFAITATSTDGVNFYIPRSQRTVVMKFVTFGNGEFIGLTSSGKVEVSTDGLNWSEQSTPAPSSWNSMAYGRNTFVVVSSSGSGIRAMIAGPPSFTFSSYAETATINSPITGYSITPTGSPISSYSISPTPSNGSLAFDTTTGLLSGTPTNLDTGTIYTITGTNGTSPDATAIFTLVVSETPAPPAPPAPVVIPDPPQTSSLNSATPITGPLIGGTVVRVAGSFEGCRVLNVSVDGFNLPLSQWSGTSSGVSVTMPAHIAGSVDVMIWNGCAPVLTPITYLYSDHPVIVDTPSILPATLITETTTASEIAQLESATATTTTTTKTNDDGKKPGALSAPKKLKVYFDMSSHKVAPTAREKIQSFAKEISTLGKEITITVTGYAQPTPGSEATDGPLSEHRAAAIAGILRSAGVNTRVEYQGAGRAKSNVPTSRYVEIVASNR